MRERGSCTSCTSKASSISAKIPDLQGHSCKCRGVTPCRSPPPSPDAGSDRIANLERATARNVLRPPTPAPALETRQSSNNHLVARLQKHSTRSPPSCALVVFCRGAQQTAALRCLCLNLPCWEILTRAPLSHIWEHIFSALTPRNTARPIQPKLRAKQPHQQPPVFRVRCISEIAQAFL